MEKELKELNQEQINEIFKLTFESNHSPGFKKSEVKDMLTDSEYCFNEWPKEGYKELVINYLKENGFTLPVTKIWI